MSEKVWLPIPGYEGSYEVSNNGEVRGIDRATADGRRWRGKQLRLRKDRHGYLKAYLTKDGKTKGFFCHRLVLQAFIGPPPFDLAEAAHLDGTRTNNIPDNLIWATRKENSDHMSLHGTSNGGAGEANSMAVLTTDEVKRIREARLFGATVRDMAAVYGVGKYTIDNIVSRRSWTHM